MANVKKTDLYTENVLTLFKRKGMDISMENIATEIGVSKKTLYNNYADKVALYNVVLKYINNIARKKIVSAFSKNGNCIKQVFALMDGINSYIDSLGVVLISDLMKDNGGISVFWGDEDNGYFFKNLIQLNIENGKKEGVYREDIDNEIAATIFSSVFNMRYIKEEPSALLYGYKNFIFESIKYYLYALTNDKGRLQVDELLKNEY